MKSILLITYYWPPGGGAGVHRWLRFSKYFREKGWDFHVYCPEDAAWPTRDEALKEQIPMGVSVIRKKIFEPHKYIAKKSGFTLGSGLGTQTKKKLIHRLLILIRGNLFIPDAKKYWIRPSSRYLVRYLKQHPEIQTIISTGPPHTTHVIARNVKRKTGIKWVADFRDPWTEIDFYADLQIGKWADRKQKQLEKSVLQEADTVVTVSKAWAESLEKIGKRKVDVVSNGYIFENFDPKSIVLDSSFSIAHFGAMPATRNPSVLWEILSELLIDRPEIKDHLEIKLIGSVDFGVFESLKKNGLESFVVHIPSVHHGESIRLQRTTQVLLLIANNSPNVKGILPGKLFEYLGAKRPILAIGAESSNLETIISETASGKFILYSKKEECKQFVLSCFEAFLANNLYANPVNTEKFDSGFLAETYMNLIEKLNPA